MLYILSIVLSRKLPRGHAEEARGESQPARGDHIPEYVCVYDHCVCVYTYIYIYRERERERRNIVDAHD